MPAVVYRGGCFCGAVRYALTAPLKFVAHDHCSICRRIAGAAFVTWVGVAAERFVLETGADALTTFRSSPEAERQFCRTCGSHLFFRSTRWPGEVHATRATLDAPVDEAPRAHVFWDDRARWLDGAEALPRLGGPTGTEPVG